jgi:quinol-cytochrome oxidoreductase complex cytochrome b subunit
MYMFEAHGAAEPPSRPGARAAKETDPAYREFSWFPSVYLYIGMIGSALVAIILAASALFPMSLGPEFSPQAAASTTPQPEWYFMWIYQWVKIASFEGSGIYVALGLVTVAVAGLVLLPFFDRSGRRDIAVRPLYTTVGLVLIAELLVMTGWGFLTPGQVIPDSQALVVMVGTAAVIAVMTAITYRMRRRAMVTTSSMSTARPKMSHLSAMALPFTHKGITALFLAPLVAGSVSLSNLVGGVFSGAGNSLILGADLTVLVVSMYIMGRILRSMAVAQRGSRS